VQQQYSFEVFYQIAESITLLATRGTDREMQMFAALKKTFYPKKPKNIKKITLGICAMDKKVGHSARTHSYLL
jgi:hypothetical protein